MSKQRGNPNFHLRLSPEQRRIWQKAAEREKRTLSNFIRIAADERANQKGDLK